MGFRRKRREEIKPELTPMVDVVFLLLIFFMISTTFVETPGISIKLPESTAKQVEREPKEVKVYVSGAGDIFLNKKQYSLAQLRGELVAMGRKAPDTTFFLLADRDTRHGRVVQVMDVAKEAGFRKLAVATEQKSR